MKKIIPMMLSIGAAAVAGVVLTKQPVKVAQAGEDKIIKPFAEFLFQDENNFGKDTSGNGFDLRTQITSAKEEAIQLKEEGGEKYLAIHHDQWAADDPEKPNQLKDSGGAWLFAPELGTTNKDFSDLIQGNYTVSITMRADYYFPFGNAYALNFGRYCSAFQVVPWQGGLEISTANTDFFTSDMAGGDNQKWLEGNRVIVPIAEEKNNQWVTLTVSGEADTGKMRVFLDGQFKQELVSPTGSTRLSNINPDFEACSYTFSIGGQCDVRGGSVDPLIGAICDYKQVRIFDCKLSDANIAELYAGKNAVISKQEEGNNAIVTEIEQIDASAYDLEITDANTVNNVINDQLAGKKVKATISNGNKMSYETIWYPAADGATIKGKLLISDGINCDNVQAEMTYKYVCKLDYDAAKVDISDIYLDNKDYVFGSEITSTKHTVKFVVTPKKGITIETVEYNGMEWEAEEDDEIPAGSYLFIIQFTKGAKIILTTSGEVKGGGGGSASGGCGGSVIACSALISALALAGVVLLKKKED